MLAVDLIMNKRTTSHRCPSQAVGGLENNAMLLFSGWISTKLFTNFEGQLVFKQSSSESSIVSRDQLGLQSVC